MSSNLDLSAHASDIAATHRRILANDPDVAWAVFGFDRGGSALNVQAQGSGGVDELADEFDDGKVQFAFARVMDPNTRLPKFVFISWCGQGVPVFRKGLVGQQVGEVQRVLGNYHVAIVARTEEDVRPSEIMDQVSRSSGAQYSYHTQQPKRQPPPVAAAKPAPAAFRKGGTYGAPTVSKGPAWEAAAAALSPPSASLQRPPHAQSPRSVNAQSPRLANAQSPPMSAGGTKPLFGAPSRSGLPPPPPPSQEPARLEPAYRSQQDERQAELEALRRGSRTHSSASGSRGGGTTPSMLSPRAGAQTPSEPSAHISQADQTKSELEMLRNRRMLNSGLGAPGVSSENSAASERKAELDAIRRARSGSQAGPSAPQPSPPVHSWNQSPSQGQFQRQEEDRRRQEEEEEDRRRRDEAQRKQREAEEAEQQQREVEARRRQQEQQRRQEEQQERERVRREEEEADARAAAAAAASQAAASSREPRARAVYDYDAQDDDELGFKEGEIIYRIDKVDAGWWAGESADGQRQGVFPSNFVEMIEPAAPGAAQGISAVASFEYVAAEDEELSFVEGDQIVNIEQLSSDWWEGTNTRTGAHGLFPANHVELR